MMENKSFENATKSHSVHELHINEMFENMELLNNYFLPMKKKESLGYLLSERVLSTLSPFYKTKNTWLTVGDLTGFEANFLTEHQQMAIASDIDVTILEEAKKRGYIQECRAENVENLSFKENTIDYVFCREAYHHFPRAFLGAYEMIRVSRKASIFIEPIDILSKIPLLLFLKNISDLVDPSLINKIWKNRFSFETVGNYVFKVSEREFEKMAMGIGLPCIAFKGLNIILDIDREEFFKIPVDKKILKKIYRKIGRLDFFSRLHFIPFNTLCTVMFKEMPSEDTLKEMKQTGYTIIHLPKNPYLK